MKVSRSVSGIVSGLLGALAFLVFFFVISPASILLSLVAGVAVFVGISLIFRARPAPTLELGGAGEQDYRDALKDGWLKRQSLSDLALRISKPSVKSLVQAIGQTVESILKDLETDPKDFPRARQFLTYYLGATLAIVQRYAELSGKGGGSELDKTLVQVEDTLGQVKRAFEKQLQILLENDVMDLDADLKVLRSTIAMEGLGDQFDVSPASQSAVVTAGSDSTLKAGQDLKGGKQ